MIWSLALGVHHFISYGGWVIIWLTDWFLRYIPPYSRRMARGKYARWAQRQFGLLGHSVPLMFMAAAMLVFYVSTDWVWPIDMFYVFLAVTCAIDWITGSDDPPWRRWAKSGAEILKKLRIEPAPEPAINT